MKELAIKRLHTLLVKEGYCNPTSPRTYHHYETADGEDTIVPQLRELYIEVLSEGATWDRTTGVRLIPTGIVTPSATIHLHEPKSNRIKPTTRPSTTASEDIPMKNQFEKAALMSVHEVIDHVSRKGQGTEIELPIPKEVCSKLRRAYNYLTSTIDTDRADNLKVSNIIYLIFDQLSAGVVDRKLSLNFDNFGLDLEDTGVSLIYQNTGILVLLDKLVVMDLTSRRVVEWHEDIMDIPPYPELVGMDMEETVESDNSPASTEPLDSSNGDQTPPKGKAPMTPTKTSAISQIAQLLTVNELYHDKTTARRVSYNHTKAHALPPSIISSLKTLYRQALREGIVFDTSTDVELRPHGIFTPGSIIHLWKYVDYPIAKTMKYFKGERFADLTIEEIKEVELDIQKQLSPKCSDNTLGAFWELFFTTVLVNRSTVINITDIDEEEGRKVWAVVVQECHPVDDNSVDYPVLEFNSPAHQAMAKALGIKFAVCGNTLQLLTPGVNLTLLGSQYPKEYKQLEALVYGKDITLEESPPISEQATQEDTPEPMDINLALNPHGTMLATPLRLVHSVADIIGHLTQQGTAPETQTKLPSKFIQDLLGAYVGVYQQNLSSPAIVNTLKTVLTTYPDQLKSIIPELVIVIRPESDVGLLGAIIGDIKIKITLDTIQVDDILSGLRVIWHDDGTRVPEPRVVRHYFDEPTSEDACKNDSENDQSRSLPSVSGGKETMGVSSLTPQQAETLLQRFFTLLTTHINIGHTQFSENASVSRVLSILSEVEGFENTLLENGLVINQVTGEDEHWELVGMFGPTRQTYGPPTSPVITVRFIPKGDTGKFYLTFQE